jgi:hypothetical protein
MIRQNIMCNADVGVISHQWVKGIPDPFANFNTNHKCRDINAVREWIDKRTVPDAPEGGSFPIPKGSKIWAQPP